MKALLVDDNCENIKIMSQILKEEGFSIDSFASYEEATKDIAKNYVIGLVDYWLIGEKTGADIIKEYKKVNSMAEFVLFSGDLINIPECDKILLKPIDIKEIRECIREVKKNYIKSLESGRELSDKIIEHINHNVNAVIVSTARKQYRIIGVSLVAAFILNIFIAGGIYNIIKTHIDFCDHDKKYNRTCVHVLEQNQNKMIQEYAREHKVVINISPLPEENE